MLKVILWIVFGVVALGFIGSMMKGTTSADGAASTGAAKPYVDQAISHVLINKFDWRKGGFDDVAFVTMTLKNSSTRPIKDIGIVCEFAGKSGTIVGTGSATIFDILPAGKTKTFPELSTGFINSQSAGGDCKIADATWG